MNFLLGALAILSAIVLTGTAVSVIALRRAHGLLHELRSWPAEALPAAAPPEDQTRELRATVESLAAQVRELQRTPAAPADAAAPRAGFNVTKRSQALRLHRQGESADQIAASLQLPRQEVELLLKVQRIVLSTV
jgi:DNA-binding NarL/FixJ family response regulator